METRRIQAQGLRPLDPRDETSQPAVFQDSNHFIAAPSVEYVAGTNGAIGRFFASGPGQYRGSPRPGEVPAFEAEWQEQISLRPVQGEHELALDGGVRVASEQWGRMAAETVKVTLSEVAKSQETRLGNHTPNQPRTTLEPRQFVAVAPTSGFIDFDSPQMSGRLQKLTVVLRAESLVSAPAAAAPPGMMRFPLDDRRTASPKPNANSKYHVQGGEVTAWLDRGRTTEVRFVQIDRDAHLVQTQGVIPGQQPLDISGDFVQIKNPSDGQGRALIKGLPAIVKASELELRGHAIRLDEGTNRLWIDGAGTMHLPMPKGAQGNQLPPGGRLQISWRGGMDFDGETIKYSDDVIVASPQQQVRTEELHARLDRYISFSQPPKEMRDVNLLTLHANSDVLLTNHTVDPAKGLLSVDRLSVRDLNLNQQSGEILAHGPGWIARTFPRGSISLPGAKPTGNSDANPPVAGAGSPLLSYLKVVFQDRMDGNFHRQEVRLRDQVEAIYGPVSSWDDQLDPRAPLRPEDTRLSCDELAVMQFGPTRREQSLELLARGNTFVETQTFAARGHQIKYTQGKNMLILEGNGRQAAELFRRGRVGGPVMRHAAQRILYWPSLQQVEIDGGKYLDVSNLPSSPGLRR